jgi:hypothetical protein
LALSSCKQITSGFWERIHFQVPFSSFKWERSPLTFQLIIFMIPPVMAPFYRGEPRRAEIAAQRSQ